MKALLSTAVGGPDTLTIGEVAEPVPTAGQVVVDVHACAINFPDTLIIEDKYQFRPARPFSPGADVAGVVSALGEGVTGLSVGDRVMACTTHGGLAEKIAINAAACHALPANRSYAEGAAMVMTYGTSIHALIDRGHLKAGETLLVLGAAGGVGIAAVEIGKALGARVIAAVSSEEKAALARAAGADDCLVYPYAPFDKDQSKALAEAFKDVVGPGGANVIYDAVGGDYAEPALRSIAWEGRYLVVGFPAGIPRLPLNLTLLKSCDVCGVFWGAYTMRDAEGNRAHFRQLQAWWDEGKISPRVTATYPFERGGEAIAALGNRQAAGKLVVTIRE